MRARRGDRSALALTPHARQRAQQRAISAAHIDAALAWGRPYYQGLGRVAYFLGRRDAKRAMARGVDVRGAANTAIVVGADGGVITALRTATPRRLWRERR